MNVAVVIGNVVSTLKHPAYQDRKLLLVQMLDLNGKPKGVSTIAVDYVGAGEGDVVLIAAAPGLAPSVFNMKVCPIRDLVVGIIDRIDAVPIGI